jgi:hypothetical protein
MSGADGVHALTLRAPTLDDVYFAHTQRTART